MLWHSTKTFSEYKHFEPQVKYVPCCDCFIPLTEREIKKLISDLNTTSSELDPIPTSLLKCHADVLLSYLTQLVNLSLEQGIFPVKYKQAIVRPLLKTVGLEFSNYRPVSNLYFRSKLIQKAVLYRLNSHVDSHSLLPKNQSACRKFHS